MWKAFFVAILAFGTDASVAKKINQMDHANWQIRDSALKDLMKLDEQGMIQVRMAAKGHKSLEVRRRCQYVLDAFIEKQIEETRPTHYSKMPWICRLPDNYPKRDEIVNAYLQPACQQFNYECHRAMERGLPRPGCDEKGEDWLQYRIATTMYVRDLYNAGYTKKQVVDMLDQMVIRERDWWLNTEYQSHRLPAELKKLKK